MEVKIYHRKPQKTKDGSKNISLKTTKTKDGNPWITEDIKR